jgi:Protein of unknown function (DUF1214)
VAIGANSAQEAIHQIYEKDANDEPFDYALHFAKGHEPPVKAFWSLTMYDLPGQFLVKNPINRYLINSQMLPDLKRDADGGLTLYIQNESPGKALESNWLPAPSIRSCWTYGSTGRSPKLSEGAAGRARGIGRQWISVFRCYEKQERGLKMMKHATLAALAIALPLTMLERERKLRLDPVALEKAKKFAPAQAFPSKRSCAARAIAADSCAK